MSQNNVDFSTDPSGAALLDDLLTDLVQNLLTNHSGTARPTYIQAGGTWLDTTTNPWILNLFDGTNDIPMGTFDTSTNLFTAARQISPWCGSSGGTANALTFTPSPARTAISTGDIFIGLIGATNTAEAPTIAFSGLTAKSVKCSVGAGKVNLPKGGHQNGMIGMWVYDGTDLILLNIRSNNISASIATAGTIVLDNASGDYVPLTGTTTCTAITLAEGVEKTCLCGGIFVLTNGASLILPGGANITTAAGDVFVVRGEASGVVRVVNYMRASGQPIVGASGAVTQVASSSGSLSFALDSNFDDYEFEFDNLLPATGNQTLYMQGSTDGGSTWISTGSTYVYQRYAHVYDATSFLYEGSAGSDNMTFRYNGSTYLSTSANCGISGKINLQSKSGFNPTFQFQLSGHESVAGKFASMFGSGKQTGTTKFTNVRFIMSSGNLSSGRITMRPKAK